MSGSHLELGSSWGPEPHVRPRLSTRNDLSCEVIGAHAEGAEQPYEDPLAHAKRNFGEPLRFKHPVLLWVKIEKAV